MNDGTAPIQYVLFSHYGYREGEDFKAFQTGTHPKDLKGIQYLSDHFRGLRELLTAPGYRGMLVLFYSPGYEKFLEGLAHGEDDQWMLQNPELRFASEVADHTRSMLEKEQLADRVRFLTSLDLRAILGRVNAIYAEMFRRFFLGQSKGIRYDATKIVEAILRLRALGNGVPVFRLDHDVIFRGEAIDDLGLFKAVACSLRAYQLRMAAPTVSTFLFSASYNVRTLLDRSPGTDDFEAWSRAFATRLYPALIADPNKIRWISALADGTLEEKARKNDQWDTYVRRHVDAALARRFYGLTADPTKLEPEGLEGITSVGAHPLYSVISGALLCLSDGAILDLPPYSNLGINVMWIDDHLKYSLHRAMNHFTSEETLDLEPGLRHARLDDVTVTKARPAAGNLQCYVFDIYLPTLLWGTVMDAWIISDPILKCRVSTLDSQGYQRWRMAGEAQHEAPLPRAMLDALRTGTFGPGSEASLREDLRKVAVLRIEQVRQSWAALKSPEHRTFASYWAEGNVADVFGSENFRSCPERLWQGIAPDRPLNEPIAVRHDLSIAVALKLEELISDTIDYVHWTLEWPKFVQIVRSIRQGTFIGDLNWQPKQPI
jgi:hypothetical protein